ncbi:2-iminobutanoate/2-iminopropanoate deaminase [Lachnellula suecica]|uniref:2-iminobutanoate/2-iminopropanoate deaminase n=1 Tax=Lachnellula suecica TaxID=602035 RepID=A0A8T9CG43_9HELO|nr:2-iminobutanoate/2-iminopropanoate deaminase [Lachnellula suecica]
MSHLQYFSYPGYGDRNMENYAQAVRVNNTIEISGQGGWDPETDVIPTDIALELDQIFKNVQLTLTSAGGKGWSQVYKVRIYTTRYDDEMMGHIVRNLKVWCPDHKPIATGFEVSKLAFDGMRVEIEVKADVGSDGK